MLAGNISSKSNLTQQDPSDLCTSQGLKTYYFRDETMHMDWTSQAFGKLELLHKCFWLPPTFHLRGLCLEFAHLLSRVLFRPSLLSNLSQLIINAFQSPLLPAPEHHPHLHTLLPSHRPSWLSPFTPTAWNPQLDASAALSTQALRFLSPNMALVQLPTYMPYLSCCSLPAYPSISLVSYALETDQYLLSSDSRNWCSALFSPVQTERPADFEDPQYSHKQLDSTLEWQKSDSWIGLEIPVFIFPNQADPWIISCYPS